MTKTSGTELPVDTSLFEHLATGVVLTDENENIIWVNDCFLELMAAERNSVLGAPFATLLKANILATVRETQVCRYTTRNDRDEKLWLQSISQDLDAGNAQYTLRILIDITEFQHRQNIRALVNTGIDATRLDQASGVLNRRSIVQELSEEISRSRRYGNPLSAILLFYPLSSGMEHKGKTALLQSVTTCLNGQLRWVDKLGRLDEDELLIVLPESDLTAAHQTWDKINTALQEMTVRREQLGNDYAAAITAWQKNDTQETLQQRLHGMLIEKKVA